MKITRLVLAVLFLTAKPVLAQEINIEHEKLLLRLQKVLCSGFPLQARSEMTLIARAVDDDDLAVYLEKSNDFEDTMKKTEKCFQEYHDKASSLIDTIGKIKQKSQGSQLEASTDQSSRSGK